MHNKELYCKFIDTVCSRFGITEAIEPLRQGFNAYCEAVELDPDTIAKRVKQWTQWGEKHPSYDLGFEDGESAQEMYHRLSLSDTIPSPDAIVKGIKNKYAPGDYPYDSRCEARAKYTIDAIQSLQFPLTVYRGLKINPGNELRTTGDVGKHWTYNPDMFSSNKSLEWFSETSGMNVILSGTVMPSDVNWYMTVMDNSSDFSLTGSTDHAEYEIELKRGHLPTDIKIYRDTRA